MQVNRLKEELVSRGWEVERLQELASALKAAHVAWPERRLAAALAAWSRARDAYRHDHEKQVHGSAAAGGSRPREV